MPTIEIETLIRAPLELCFDLSVDVDIHQQSVAGTSERAVAGVTSGRMVLGDEVTWEARHLGQNPAALFADHPVRASDPLC